MEAEHKTKHRTYCLRPETIQFLDSFAETYGVSRSAVVNLVIRDFQHTLDAITRDDPSHGAKVALAFGMAAQRLQGGQND